MIRSDTLYNVGSDFKADGFVLRPIGLTLLETWQAANGHTSRLSSNRAREMKGRRAKGVEFLLFRILYFSAAVYSSKNGRCAVVVFPSASVHPSQHMKDIRPAVGNRYGCLCRPR